MEHLKNIIIKESLSNSLTDVIYKHISIELYDEYGYTLYNNAHIFEKLGSFENSGKIVMVIFEKLISNINKNEVSIDCKELNTFFDYVNIQIGHNDVIEGEYYSRERNTIYMNLNVPQKINSSKDWNPIMKIILHELLHAYEDYNRGDSIFNHFNKEYSKSYRFMRTSFIETNKKLFEFGYFYNDQERNAYSSNIYNDIKDVLKKLDMTKIEKFDYTKFIEELKNTDIWKTYFDIVNFVANIDNLSENDKENIISTFSFIKEKKMTFNQIKKELNNKVNKFVSKFNQLVPKCICKIIEVDNKKVPNRT